MTRNIAQQCLDELIEPGRTITYGVVKPGAEDENGIRFVRGGDIQNGKVDVNNLRTITQDISKSYSRTLLRGGELLISLVGNPGNVTIAPDSLIGANIARQVGLIPLRNDINAKYVMYYLMSPNGKAQIFMRTQGAVQQVINLADVKKIPIKLPHPETQCAIADTLSTYDDLIENNKRRIELLEESARQLYKEWFVRFRFPGHEHVKIIDGVPEGWTAGCVGDIAKVFSGYAFKSKDWLDEGNPVIKIKNITSTNTVDVSDCQCVNDNVAEKTNKFRLSAGDMLIAMTGATVGKVGLMPTSERTFYLNQRVGKFESKIGRDVTSLLLSFFNSDKAQSSILNLAGGAAQPNISAKQIESIKLPIPPTALLNTFLDETENLFSLRLNIVDQNFRLTQARDILLPKLMNGEIAV